MKKEVKENKKEFSFLNEIREPRRTSNGYLIIISEKITSENIDILINELNKPNVIEGCRNYTLRINNIDFSISEKLDPNNEYSYVLKIPAREEFLKELKIKEKKVEKISPEIKNQDELNKVKETLKKKTVELIEITKKLEAEKTKGKEKEANQKKLEDEIEKKTLENNQLNNQIKELLAVNNSDKPDRMVIDIDVNTDYINKLKFYEYIEANNDKKIQLAEYGKNNTQIFTRETDILKMIDSIGKDIILNPETTILEPTSGDGAFTVRILTYRLDKIINEIKTLDEFLLKSLISLSTIYSIEYEPDTAFIQRCNLYTVMILKYKELWKKLFPDTELKENNDWNIICKKIIFDNIMWGAFAATNNKEYKNYEKILGFDRSSGRALSIVKWNIKIIKNKITYYKTIIS